MTNPHNLTWSCQSCHFNDAAAALTAETIGCSPDNIRAYYYFISMTMTDDRHFCLDYEVNIRLNLTKVVCF